MVPYACRLQETVATTKLVGAFNDCVETSVAPSAVQNIVQSTVKEKDRSTSDRKRKGLQKSV